MRKLILILICFSSFGRAVAQNEAMEPSRFITKFRFLQLTGGIILMQGRLDPFPDTLNFVLDSGSGGISLDSTTAARFGLKSEESNRSIRGIAGLRVLRFVNNRKLHLPGLSIDSLNFHVNDYNILTMVYGEKIDGIIGYSVLSRYILKIDYDSSHVEFWTKGAMKYPRGGFLLRPVINTLPVHPVRVKDEDWVSARFLYDMGAGLNMMFSSDFVRDSSFMGKKRKYYTKEGEGLGGKIDMKLTVVKEIRLGPYRFHNVPVYIFDDHFNVTSYPYLGGLIGNDLLRRFNVILNYDRQDFYLTPNSHFKDLFDYSYSGIELYLQDGLIMLGDVAKGSPAEIAGLKEGDIVVAINANFNQNLQTYKLALQNAGERIRIIVERDEELLQFEVKIQNILRN